jgi:hypothetical protein
MDKDLVCVCVFSITGLALSLAIQVMNTGDELQPRFITMVEGPQVTETMLSGSPSFTLRTIGVRRPESDEALLLGN